MGVRFLSLAQNANADTKVSALLRICSEREESKDGAGIQDEWTRALVGESGQEPLSILSLLKIPSELRRFLSVHRNCFVKSKQQVYT